jgi:hypothetical protein
MQLVEKLYYVIHTVYTDIFNPATLQPEKDCKSRHANEVMQLHVIHNLADIRILPEYYIYVTVT